MRSAADNNSEIVKTLSSGTPVKILNVEGNWYQISVENSQGYVYKTYLALDSGNSDTVFTNDATLDSSVKTLEDTETAITYEDSNSGSNMDSDASEDEQAAQEDNFSRSKSSSASKFTVYATTGINVRSKPSTSSSKIGSLSKGSAVKATALNNGWYTIIYKCTECSISTFHQFLKTWSVGRRHRNYCEVFIRRVVCYFLQWQDRLC